MRDEDSYFDFDMILNAYVCKYCSPSLIQKPLSN